MDVVDLQRPECLPEMLRRRLASIEHLCRGEEFSEALVQHPDVREVAVEINDYCVQRRVLGIHYTRAIRSDIESNGLLVRTGDEIRKDFVERFGHQFTSEELSFLNKLWASHQAKQADIRDSRLWFNFTTVAFPGPGSEYLLGMYGGEQIHMGIEFDMPIGKKLAGIGEPLLVKCALDPNKIRTFLEHPWGEILVSSLHLSVEPEAYRIDQDGKINESVSPEYVTVEPAH